MGVEILVREDRRIRIEHLLSRIGKVEVESLLRSIPGGAHLHGVVRVGGSGPGGGEVEKSRGVLGGAAVDDSHEASLVGTLDVLPVSGPEGDPEVVAGVEGDSRSEEDRLEGVA